MKTARIFAALAAAAGLASAHEGEPLAPHDLWQAWSFDPGIVLPLAITALLFLCGAKKTRGVTIVRFVCFWCGWLVLALALLSPLHPLGEALFSAHMLQHELLMIVAAPLLVLSRPLVPMLWGLPLKWRRRLGQASKASPIRNSWRAITRPMAAWWIHAAALWLWHVPALFERTLASDWIHSAQHVSFLFSALLFWWSVFYAQNRASYGASVLYVFTTAVHTSILGALLTFARTVWYPSYLSTTAAWGLTPLEDQQLGGLIMWIPAALVYIAASLWMLAAWLRESEIVARTRAYAR